MSAFLGHGVVVSSATPKDTNAEKELVAKAEACGIKKATIQKHIKRKGLPAVAAIQHHI